MSLHFFIVEPDQPLFRIPLSVMEQLPEHRAALRDYAGKQLRVAEVATNDDENGAPQQARNVWGMYLHLDENGLVRKDIYQEWISSAFYKMDFGFPGKENVVDLEQRAKRRDAERKHEWKPTQEELSLIVDAALGHPKAIKNVKSTKLKKPPGPKVSYESRSAFDEIEEAIRKISFAVYQLDEPELLGLQQLIEEHIESIAEHRPIWRGVLADNVEALKLMEAKRTGAGDWIAVVEIMRWNEKGNEGVCIKSWEEKHPTREAALEAVKRLASEHASEIQESTSLDARVESALEWQE